MRKSERRLFVGMVSVVSLILAACGGVNEGLYSADDLGAIVGGSEPLQGSVEKNSTVAIGRYNKNKGRFASFCSGVVISKNLILTAAHCLQVPDEEAPKVNNPLLVYFGSRYEGYDKSLERTADAYLINDKYAPIHEEEFQMVVSALGDMAIIKIESEIPHDVSPVKIGVGVKLAKGQTLTAAGWGITKISENENVHYTVGVSLEEPVSEPVDPDQEVENSTDRLYQTEIKFIDYWKSHLVVETSKNKGVCEGDSGGPAYFKTSSGETLVVGTVRGGHGFQSCGGLIEYTNTTNNVEFIKQAAVKLGGALPQFYIAK